MLERNAIACYRTTTAPSPLNLLTTWTVYFIKLCKKRSAKRKHRPSLVHMMGLHRADRLSPRSKMGAKWLAKIKKGQVRPAKDNVRLSMVHLSPLGSQLSFNSATRIESVVDWDMIRKKYLALTGNEPEKEGEEKEEKGDEDENEDENGPTTASNASTIPASSTIPNLL